MKIIQKILIIAVVGLPSINAECTQAPVQQPQTLFDLPTDTPGLQKNADGSLKSQPKTICEQQKACVHVIVPGTRAEEMLNTDNGDEGWNAAIKCNGNIYFPADGTQPTTEEAVEYSCANIDNQEDSRITEWYMQMFGVILFQKTGNPANDYVKAGYKAHSVSPARCQIITLDTSSEETPVNFERQFQKAFRVIASNPVGRVLLYRMLIEIRRTDEHGSMLPEGWIWASWEKNTAIDKNKISSLLNERNHCGCITICFNQKDSRKDGKENCLINCNFSDRNYPAVLFKNDFQYIMGMVKSIPEQRILHELIHVFHRLRNIYRVKIERRANIKELFSKKGVPLIYWFPLLNDQKAWSSLNELNVSCLPWISFKCNTINDVRTLIEQDNNRCKLEEIRTICGSPLKCESQENFNIILPPFDFQYLEGDDISENLFLISIGKPIRFGHEKFSFLEDKKVIDKVLFQLNFYGKFYGFPLTILPKIDGLNVVGFNGLGNFFANGVALLTKE